MAILGFILVLVAGLAYPPLGFCLLAGMGLCLMLYSFAKGARSQPAERQTVRAQVCDDTLAALFK